MVFQHKYALIAAGSVGRTLIGRLPAKSRQIGPVAASSYRVASRIANSLRAGSPVREMTQLDSSPNILFHAPDDQIRSLLRLCLSSPLEWQGKNVIFCDCVPSTGALRHFHQLGAATAIARTFGAPGFAVIQGCPTARPTARRLVHEVGLKSLEMEHDRAPVFAAAVTMSTAALTPLIDRAAHLFRCAGVRDVGAIKVARLLFDQTVRGYSHSGRQSWAWHVSAPCPDELNSQLDSMDSRLASLLRQLLLLGFDTFEKHSEVAALIRTSVGVPM